MTKLPGYAKYRAVLRDGNEQEFAVVVVQDTGSVSWTVVSEQEFNDANCDDLPDDLFDQVNSAYGNLKLLGNDVPDEGT